MAGISLAYADELRTMGYVYKAVAKAVKPFYPGRITAHQHEMFLGPGPNICIDVQTLPDFRFKYTRDRADILTKSPVDLVVDLAQDAYNYFFYRPALPVDDHIILGEN